MERGGSEASSSEASAAKHALGMKVNISNKKSPPFFMNLVKRIFSTSDTQDIELSALAGAIPTAVTVAEVLKRSGLVEITGIKTNLVVSQESPSSDTAQKAQIIIHLRRTPGFEDVLEAEKGKVKEDRAQAEVVLPTGGKFNNAADVEASVALLKAKPGAFRVKFSGNTIGPEAARALAAALEPMPQLKAVDLSDIFTGRLTAEIPDTLEILCSALAKKPTLREVDLSDNAFGPNGCQAVLKTLLVPGSPILALRFNNQGNGKAGAVFLSKGLKESGMQLKAWSSGRNRLELEGATTLCSAFQQMNTLRELRLYQNGIPPAGITMIAQALKNNLALEHLDLNDNTVKEEGMSSLAEVIPDLKELTVLNLGDCLLQTGGGRVLAGAIHSSRRLREVHLAFNELDDAAAAALVPSLTNNKPCLRTLDVNGNEFKKPALELLRANIADGVLGSLSDNEDDDDDDDDDDE